jgi:hypothetical protein
VGFVADFGGDELGVATSEEAKGRSGGGLSMLVSLSPWIAVWVLVSNDSWVPGMLVATACSLGLFLWTIAEGKKPKLLDWGTFGGLAGLTVVSLVAGGPWLGAWLSALLNAVLFAIISGSLVVGRPFTIDYAKEETPPEIWDTPGFMHVNFVITWVWAGALAAMLAGSVVFGLYASGTLTTPDPKTAESIETWANWAPTVVALVVAMKFTKAYPDRYRARMEAAARGAS